ncbi:hypothetical protein BST97_08445 [Nonlabens spongiae]|uniref:Secretion system C-terminal sorting domain-containing protein n=1 Tax=Nonlabens spongiae TaxID=331648 RepID=A0A1W6MKC8_9FLAO|nr:T9SS type A sorting domain-containing protein [Nonlabens spongiae]ARN78027.1 hypothetical protein BST97_08445 [Nonlabens spongiae]
MNLKLPSIVIIYFILMITQSHAQNNLESIVEQFWNGASYEDSNGRDLFYDSNGNLITDIYYFRNGLTWEPSEKTDYIYGSNGMVSQEIFSIYQGSGMPTPYSRTSYTYSSNNVTFILDEEFENGQWVNQLRGQLSYNSNGISQFLIEEWTGSSWFLTETIDFIYSNNRLTEVNFEYWDGSQYINDGRDLYTYNSNGQVATYTIESWDGSNYVDPETLEYTYDVAGNLTQLRESYDNGNGNLFVNLSDYNYDTNNLMASYNNPFNDRTGIDYLFDVQPNYVNQISEILTTQDSNNSGNFTPSNRKSYNYDTQLLSAQEIVTENEIIVFPNPTSSILYIDSQQDLKQIDVFSITGKLVLTLTKNLHEVNLSNLTSGVYLIKLQDVNGNSFVKRIVKS